MTHGYAIRFLSRLERLELPGSGFKFKRCCMHASDAPVRASA